MPTHTPGPWHIAEDMRGIGNQHVSGVCDMVGNPVANCGTNAEANACLIAAAPDLLAALERARNHLIMSGTRQTDAPEALAQCVSAIAKAKGEA